MRWLQIKEEKIKKAIVELYDEDPDLINIIDYYDPDIKARLVEITGSIKTYIVFENEEEMINMARNRIMGALVYEPELFNKDWLRGEYQSITREDFTDEHTNTVYITLIMLLVLMVRNIFYLLYDGTSNEYDGLVIIRTN